MSDDKCKCTLRESMLGDGCRVCQPRTYIAHLEDALKLAEGEIAQLETELAEAKKDQARYQYVYEWLEQKVQGTKEFFRAKTKEQYNVAIDAAIKEQQ